FCWKIVGARSGFVAALLARQIAGTIGHSANLPNYFVGLGREAQVCFPCIGENLKVRDKDVVLLLTFGLFTFPHARVHQVIGDHDALAPGILDDTGFPSSIKDHGVVEYLGAGRVPNHDAAVGSINRPRLTPDDVVADDAALMIVRALFSLHDPEANAHATI